LYYIVFINNVLFILYRIYIIFIKIFILIKLIVTGKFVIKNSPTDYIGTFVNLLFSLARTIVQRSTAFIIGLSLSLVILKELYENNPDSIGYIISKINKDDGFNVSSMLENEGKSSLSVLLSCIVSLAIFT
jgi:uncharacterized membrane protein YjdF